MFKLTKFLAGIVATGTVAYADDLPVIKSSKAPAVLDLPIPEAPAKLPTTKVTPTKAPVVALDDSPIKLPTTKVVQTPVVPATPATPVPTPTAPTTVPPSTMVAVESGKVEPTFWGGAEYGIWRVQRGPVANPILLSSRPGTAPIPLAGQPADSNLLFGNDNIDFGNSSGLTATLGAWLNSDRSIGAEVSYMTLQKQVKTSAFSTTDRSNLISVPFTRTDGTQQVIGIAGGRPPITTGANGNASVQMDTRFWGYDAKLVYSIDRSESSSLEAVAGYRYLSLDEGLLLQANATGVTRNPGTFTQTQDWFKTSNQFHGGQLGLRKKSQFGGFTFDIAGLLSMGLTEQTIDISGGRSTNVVAPGIPQQANYGILTHATNIGIIRQNQFAVVPEVKLNLSYNITETVAVSVGYQGIYWTNVIRPGNLIDGVMNLPAANPLLFGEAQATSGNPVPQKVATDFWAQGILFGVNVKY